MVTSPFHKDAAPFCLNCYIVWPRPRSTVAELPDEAVAIVFVSSTRLLFCVSHP